MNPSFRVLVFPGGTEIGLEINRALRECKEVRLFSAGSGVSNHAPYVFARHFVVPGIHDPEWFPALNAVLEANAIDYVFPAYDDIIVALAENAGGLKAKVVSSPLETCRITRSKRRTYERLAGDVPVPRVFPDASAVEQFPVFLKPECGQGSQNTHLVHDRDRLGPLLREHPDLLILSHLPGEEFTVDCFSDRERGLLFCAGRRRVRTRSGISVHSVPVENERFRWFAEQISRRLVFHGAWFFQVKEDADGELTLLEIAPRIAGTMALHRVQGVNFPLLSLYEQERVPVDIRPIHVAVEIDRALVNRYRHDLAYRAVYVDLDDTLIVNGRVNLDLVRFLYQCVNQGKPITLVTRHREDLAATLKKHRLTGLFDEIVHCDASACKADHMLGGGDSIFIDDSFRERREVAERTGMATFDSSMIEMLLDERV
uniref:ATP-grasp enzyme-like protein n=1 Tax=uncultured Armatimonadetes bacterium TaxID=157466 RepID=A0A6J4K9L2_9BACT|nr:ATP-grasp enzyme-like protein [uncultured Armatimonadetes bacterium]